MGIRAYDYALGDDGTLDTVIEVYVDYEMGRMNEWELQDVVRFSQEYAAQYRDRDGTLTEEGLKILGEEAIESVAEVDCFENDN